MKLNFTILAIFFSSFFAATAQTSPKVKDSARLYRSIEKYAKKSKFHTFIYGLIFESITKKNKLNNNIKIKNFAKVQGKIIRNITITTTDPFGYSAIDTTAIPSSFLNKTGNILHLKTKNSVTNNLLLISKNTVLDSLLVKESERLIRRQRFISDVNIQTKIITQDSVDVFIRVLDSWSLIPDFSSSTGKSSFSLTEKNFLGLGHEFSNSYQKSLVNNDFGYSTAYTIPNFKNTFISTTLNYTIDLDGSYSKSIVADRPFYSAFTRYAGGLIFGEDLSKTKIIDTHQILHTENYKSNFQDYWFGRAFYLFNGLSEANRTTNFIASARYFNKKYNEQELFTTDSMGIYASEQLYLASFGISARKFTQDKHIFNFNVIEDVGSGFVYNITTGYKFKNTKFNYYCGARIAKGRYYNFGYLSANLEYGTYLQDGKNFQSTINFKAIYFTNLFVFGKWKIRQFVKPQLIIGNNRIDDPLDRLTLNGNTGITGFTSQTLLGTKKLVATFQTQSYAPWKLLGFRLNPYFRYTLGMLGQPDQDFKNSNVYSELSLGFILSNDYLVFSNFQFSFSFYPTIPGDGNSIFKANAISTYDFGLQTFEISKPSIVEYQ